MPSGFQDLIALYFSAIGDVPIDCEATTTVTSSILSVRKMDLGPFSLDFGV